MAPREPDQARFAGLGLWLAPPATGVGDDHLLERAVAAAAAAPGGTGSLWVSESTPAAATTVPYEAYSLLGALAVRVAALRLGVVADGVERRAPSILAKIVTGVDVISHGRAVLSLDADGGDRAGAERLSEALTVCRMVLEDEHPAFAGRIYSVDGAVNRPAPVQPGGVPIVVFVHGRGPARRALLDEAARTADAVAVDGGPDGVRDAVGAVAVHPRPDTGPDRRVEVLGMVGAGVGPARVADAVADLRSAGATGCLVGVPHPWEPATVAGLAGVW
jgi:alkanesulfonate monooxygenase SsuD/methylene tetrahydromethanopterin reductase-like flavin-dependent oxidoreductase (luciferase family)